MVVGVGIGGTQGLDDIVEFEAQGGGFAEEVAAGRAQPG
jgi:hypothetical protein